MSSNIISVLVNKTNKIGLVINSSFQDLQKYFSNLEQFNNQQVKNIDKVFFFDSIELLEKNISNLYRPPILKVSAIDAKRIFIKYPSMGLDFKFHENGILVLGDFIDQRVLNKFKLFKFRYFCNAFQIEKRNPLMLGNKSRFSICLNSFLYTLPECIHISTIVCFISSIFENSPEFFEKTCVSNRLVTNENSQQFKNLNEEIALLAEELEDSDCDSLTDSCKYLFFLSNFFNKDPKLFLDNEGNLGYT